MNNYYKRQDFVELKQLLSNYFYMENDLSNAYMASKFAFDIEEMIIKLAEKYTKQEVTGYGIQF